MSETESSLSRFTANAAGVQSHEVGLKLKTENGKLAFAFYSDNADERCLRRREL